MSRDEAEKKKEANSRKLEKPLPFQASSSPVSLKEKPKILGKLFAHGVVIYVSFHEDSEFLFTLL